MKSGMVSEPSDSVKVRSLGATPTHAKSDSPTTNGTSRNQVTPQSYAWPENPTNELVLEYVAKNESPIAIGPIDRPPTK